jgi:hypothetical protein
MDGVNQVSDSRRTTQITIGAADPRVTFSLFSVCAAQQVSASNCANFGHQM